MNHRKNFSFALALLALAATPLAALVEPEDSALRDKTIRHPDLYIGNVYVPAGEVASARAARDLGELGIEPAAAYMDIRGGRWGTLMTSQPLLPGDGRGNVLDWQQAGLTAPRNLAEHRQVAWDAFIGYLSERQSQLGIDLSELASPGTVTIHNDGNLVQIHVDRTINGVPVRGSFLKASISHGNLVLLGATKWGDVSISSSPSISVDTAIGVASGYLGGLAEGASWPKSGLAIVPMAKGADLSQIALGNGYSYRLVWVLRPSFAADPLANWETLVDAHSGELIAFEDQTKYASKGVGSPREVAGGVYPISNDGVGDDGTEQAGYPMPFTDVTNAGETFSTDAGGNLLACVDGPIETSLSGPFLTMIDTCGAISETTAGAVLDLGTSGGIDCTVPGGASAGNTHASRSGFYELNRSIEWGRSHLPGNTWLTQQLPATMNVDANCNASGGAGGVTFFTSGGGCSNTGELAGVFVHEWGHGMDASDATPGFANPAEGIADVYASLRLNTSCIGRNFRPGVPCGGYGDPCTTCTGVRDIDWANRSSSIPHDVSSPFPTGIDALCGGGGGAPCGGSAHCEGAVFAESVWDLWNRDLQTVYGMSLDTARELATRLNFVGSGAVTNFFSCGGGTGDGCNADSGYLQFLIADDDDGALGNGTPHMAAIFAAFDRHEIACPTPTVQDSGCTGTPAAAPVVSATLLDRGVELSWPAIGGASSYRVFRTEGVHDCTFGKIWVGDTTDTSFVDSGLKNGQEHYYIVTAMGPGDSCFGPASSCTTVTPVAADNLALDLAASGAIAFSLGDGDAFIDNCEEGLLTVGVANIGTGIQTGVRIVDVRPVDHPGILIGGALPIAVDTSLTECETSTADVLFFADGLALGDVVDFEVDFTSDQLSPAVRTQIVRAAVPGAESDLQSFATKTFTFETELEDWQVAEGIFTRTGGGGGAGTTFFVDSSDAIGDQCDRIRSPVMSLSATSTMSLWNNWDIEVFSADTWYDRANVGIIDEAGDRTLVSPDTGRLYNADSSGPGNYTGCNEPEDGWAALMDTWGTSSWSAAALQSATFAGDFIQLEVIYGTDALEHRRGFWFDEVTVTDIDLQVDDAQSDVCTGATFIFADGFESGDTSAWTRESP